MNGIHEAFRTTDCLKRSWSPYAEDEPTCKGSISDNNKSAGMNQLGRVDDLKENMGSAQMAADQTDPDYAEDLDENLAKIPETSTSKRENKLVFSKVESLQASSKLLQLPNELKLMIVRMLFQFSGDLCVLPGTESEGANGHIDYHRKSVKAGLKLLQTCQRMYHDCSHTFYSENIPRIRITYNIDCDIYALSLLTTAIEIATPEIPEVPVPIDPNASQYLMKASSYTLDEHEKGSIKAAFDTIARFESVHVILTRDEFSSKDILFFLGRIFSEALKDKDIRFTLVGGPTTDGQDDENYFTWGSDRFHFTDLYGLRIIECRSWQFVDCTPPRDFYNFTPGMDTWALWQELQENYIEDLAFDVPFELEYPDIMEALEACAMQYDSGSFMKLREHLLAISTTWIRDWMGELMGNEKEAPEILTYEGAVFFEGDGQILEEIEELQKKVIAKKLEIRRAESKKDRNSIPGEVDPGGRIRLRVWNSDVGEYR